MMNNILKQFKYIFLAFAFALSGCSVFTETKEIPVYIEKQKLNLSDPAPLILDDYTFQIITYNDNKYFCLSKQDFNKLNKNNLKIINYVQELKLLINKYKEYYEPDEHTDR